MDFKDKFTEISKKVGEGVSDTYKTVADKSGKMFEEAKVRLTISDMENDIERAYADMGKNIYEKYKKGEEIEKDFTKICKKIEKANNDIAEMEKKVMFNRGIRKCDQCSAIISVDSVFCENCGVKQKPVKIKVEEKAKEEKKEQPKEKVCPTCGTVCDSKAKFCPKCGYKF